MSLCLAAATLAGAGCQSAGSDPAAGAYRTIRVEPRRDTDAARRANQRGLDFLAKGDLDRAAEQFGAALTADVEFGPAHNNLGRIYFAKKDWYKAAWEFEYAAKLMPRRAEPRGNLGLVLEEAGELDKAVDQYRQAISLDPGNIEYKANLVRTLIRRGEQTDEVRQLLQQVIDQDARPQWQTWAKQQQSRLGGTPG
jgi:Tfp pilus assembly protein PilF